MRIKFLGTAAAEGLPAVFCNCDTCRRARARGGKEIRTRSQVLIDGDTLFDFPMDTYMHMLMYKLDLSAVKRVLITHSHMDHCYPQEFCMRGEPFAFGLTENKVTVFCNQTVRDMFLSDTGREIRPQIAETINVEIMHPYDERIDGDMRIIALPARHTKGEECLVYYLERNGVGALLLNDTGPLGAEVYKKLKNMNATVNFAALDCTYGGGSGTSGRHMGMNDISAQIELIRAAGLFSQDPVLYATHFSHNTNLDFAGLTELASRHGVNVSFDGCEVEFN